MKHVFRIATHKCIDPLITFRKIHISLFSVLHWYPGCMGPRTPPCNYTDDVDCFARTSAEAHTLISDQLSI